MNETNAQVFRKGMKDAIPIGLGYLAVAFSLESPQEMQA